MGIRDRLHHVATPLGFGGGGYEEYEIWGQRGWAGVDVVGESFHSSEIRALLGGERLAEDGKEVTTKAYLVHNPRNPHDHNAIEVRGSTGLLGHLRREDAARYAHAIDDFERRGLVATTRARVWGRDGTDWETGGPKPVFIGSVRLDLPEPHMMFPRNEAPRDAHQLLPTGSVLRVSAADGIVEATRPYLCDEGECWVYATVHEVVQRGPRSSKRLAEIRVDGLPAGCLSPKMSEEMLPTVGFLASRGYVTAARAIVKGNELKAEVAVHAVKSSELPHTWMGAIPDISGARARSAVGVDSSDADHGMAERVAEAESVAPASSRADGGSPIREPWRRYLTVPGTTCGVVRGPATVGTAEVVGWGDLDRSHSRVKRHVATGRGDATERTPHPMLPASSARNCRRYMPVWCR